MAKEFKEYIHTFSFHIHFPLYWFSFSYALIGIDEITPIWTETGSELGGLNFTAANVATMMTSAAPTGIVTSLFIVPRLINRFNLGQEDDNVA